MPDSCYHHVREVVWAYQDFWTSNSKPRGQMHSNCPLWRYLQQQQSTQETAICDYGRGTPDSQPATAVATIWQLEQWQIRSSKTPPTYGAIYNEDSLETSKVFRYEECFRRSNANSKAHWIDWLLGGDAKELGAVHTSPYVQKGQHPAQERHHSRMGIDADRQCIEDKEQNHQVYRSFTVRVKTSSSSFDKNTQTCQSAFPGPIHQHSNTIDLKTHYP